LLPLYGARLLWLLLLSLQAQSLRSDLAAKKQLSRDELLLLDVLIQVCVIA